MNSDELGPEVGIWDLIPYAGIFEVAPFADEIDDQLSDAAFISAVLTFESMVAHAQGEYGVLPNATAVELAHAIRRVETDAWRMRIGMSDHATPIPALVEQIREQVGPELAEHVHVGLTSQDCIDTAHQMMQANAVDGIVQHVDALIGMLSALAEQTDDWSMLARTLARPAAPITFGYKICAWLAGLEAAYQGLLQTRTELAVQLGGAVGDQRDLGDHPVQLVAVVAEALELTVPRMPWHTERSRVLRAAASYAQAINACAKIATDILALCAPGVDELALGGDPEQAHRGASSAMAHKRNPAAAVLIRSAATQAPGLLASVAASGVHLHERAAGEWQAEWRPLRDLLHLVGGAVKELRFLIQDLGKVDREAMTRNLAAADVGEDSSAATARARDFLARYRDIDGEEDPA